MLQLFKESRWQKQQWLSASFQTTHHNPCTYSALWNQDILIIIIFFIIAKNKKYNQIFFLYYLNLKVNALVCWSENFEDFLYVKTHILRYILALCRPSN